MAEDQAQLSQTPPIGASFIINLVLGIFEKTNCLLTFVHEILHKEFEVFIVIEKAYVIFILFENDPQVLVSVWQDVQDKWWTVLQVHPPVGARIYYFVHKLPSFLYGLLVYGWLGAVLGASRHPGEAVSYIGEPLSFITSLSGHVGCLISILQLAINQNRILPGYHEITGVFILCVIWSFCCTAILEEHMGMGC